MRHYAIGDIHGQLDKLTEAHRRIAADRRATGDQAAPVVHVGDYVDRGPDVRGVLDFLIAGQASGRPWITLKGNHDRMMRAYLQQPEARDPLRPDLHWFQDNIGGMVSLASYGVRFAADRNPAQIHAEARQKVPQAHIDFLDGLPSHYHAGDLFFCHAGIRPGVPLDQQAEDDLVWIRSEFLDATADHGALIVHGHTVTKRIDHRPNRLNIDTGAGYDKKLSIVVIEDRQVFRLTSDGRQPVPCAP